MGDTFAVEIDTGTRHVILTCRVTDEGYPARTGGSSDSWDPGSLAEWEIVAASYTEEDNEAQPLLEDDVEALCEEHESVIDDAASKWLEDQDREERPDLDAIYLMKRRPR